MGLERLKEVWSHQGEPPNAMRSWLLRLLLAMLLAPLLLSMSGWPLLERLEWELYDARLAVANWARPERIAFDPRVVVVEVRPQDSARIKKHFAFWAGLYGQAGGAALEAGAEAVVVDFIPTVVEKPDLARFARAVLPHRGRFLMIAYWDPETGQVLEPEPSLVMTVGEDNLTLANQSRDQDGVARAQRLLPIAVGDQAWTLMAGALAQRAGVPLPHAALRDGRLFVNYSASQPLRVGFSEVLSASPAQLKSWFGAGRLVLIGSRNKDDQDLTLSPNCAWRPGGRWTQSLFGIDYQAQVLNTLLTQRPLQPVSSLEALLLLGLPTALVLWSSQRAGAGLNALTGVACWSSYASLALGLLISSDRLLPLVPGVVGLPLVWTAATAFRGWQEARGRRALYQTIAGYVSPDILREMLADPESWLRSLNERREVTILFSDINDFSTVSEQESPQRVAAWLNEHYREMAHVIFAHQGTIIRFIGDQFMVLFGSPKAHPQPELAAVRTALAMHARLAELQARGLPGFYGVKIGIHRGSMLLAVIGDELKRDYTAVGDAANLTARIQDLCKKVGQSTLVSEDIVQAVGESEGLRFVDCGSYAVKGRAAEVRVFSPEAQ